jgi:hypothetical protein
MNTDDEFLDAHADVGEPMVEEGSIPAYEGRQTPDLRGGNNPPPKVRTVNAAEETFAKAYARGDCSIKHALRLAGYSETTVIRKASEILDPSKNPHVVERVKELQEENAKRHGIDLDRHLRDLMTIRDAAMDAGSFAAAVSAEKIRGSAAGLHIDRKEILHGKIDQMTKEQVIARLKEIQEQHGVSVLQLPTDVIEGELADEGEGPVGEDQDWDEGDWDPLDEDRE